MTTTPQKSELTPYHFLLSMLAELALRELSTGKVAEVPVFLMSDSYNEARSAFAMLHSELRQHLPRWPEPVPLSQMGSHTIAGTVTFKHLYDIAKECGFKDQHLGGTEKTMCELEVHLDMHFMALETASMIIEQGLPVSDIPVNESIDAEWLCKAILSTFGAH